MTEHKIFKVTQATAQRIEVEATDGDVLIRFSVLPDPIRILKGQKAIIKADCGAPAIWEVFATFMEIDS